MTAPRHPRPARPPRSSRSPSRAAQPHGPGDQPARADAPRLRRGIAIVFEDDDLLVVDKPTGIITADPASSGDGGRRSARAGNTVFDVLKDYVRSRPSTPRPASRRDRTHHSRDQGVWIIHRLDKEASGLLVFAKSLRAFNWLKEDLRAKRMQREYVAVAEGIVGKPGETGTIQTFIRDDGPPRATAPHRAPRRPQAPNREPPAPDGHRLAVTHYKIVATTTDLAPRSLVLVRLDTGRKNQIRIHFAERGHPLLGDRKFGAKSDPIARLALHAAELGFAHPSSGQALRFESPAPGAFYKAVGAEPPPANLAPVSPHPSQPSPLSPPSPPSPPSPVARPANTASSANTSWDAVAGWYDALLEDRGNDHYQQVILPGTLRLLEPAAGTRVLDVACGQGILGRRLAALGVESLGVEASPRLVQAAERRAREEGLDTLCRFLVGDARELIGVPPGEFGAATCIMALANIDPLAPVLQAVAAALKPGGSFVWVITHPAFRAAGQSDWGWDAKASRQYRRVDGYLSPGQKPIEMNPGKAARGEQTATTWTFHRPLQTYIEALAKAGLVVDRLEEWPSLRASTSGPRAAEENRARREIPLFLGVRALKLGPQRP